MSHAPPPYAPPPEETKGLYPTVPPLDQQPPPPPGVYYPQQQPGPTAPPMQTAVTYYPPTGPQHQQHPQQLVVTQQPAVVTQPGARQSFVGHIILSCFVFWCCGYGCCCGLVAFIIAVVAQSKSSTEPQSVRSLGIASIVLSIVGIVVGITGIIISVVLAFTGNYLTYHCQHVINGQCYKSKIYMRSSYLCDGYYDDNYCYEN